MRPVGLGLFFGFMFWWTATTKPWIDTSWINDALGLSQPQVVILSMFVFVGIFLGSLSQGLTDLAKAHDRLVDRVHTREEPY